MRNDIFSIFVHFSYLQGEHDDEQLHWVSERHGCEYLCQIAKRLTLIQHYSPCILESVIYFPFFFSLFLWSRLPPNVLTYCRVRARVFILQTSGRARVCVFTDQRFYLLIAFFLLGDTLWWISPWSFVKNNITSSNTNHSTHYIINYQSHYRHARTYSMIYIFYTYCRLTFPLFL